MIVRVLLIYTLLIMPKLALSQHSNEAKKAVLEAAEYFHNDKYLKTLETYKTIEENLDSIPEVNFQKGICYYYLEDETSALRDRPRAGRLESERQLGPQRIRQSVVRIVTGVPPRIHQREQERRRSYHLQGGFGRF